MPAKPDPQRLLDGLNEAQREAVTLTGGPLAIIAGAGSGKTRVISHRAAYAIETGAVPAGRILLVTFTEKAAGEMVERMAALGHRGVAARTFHAHALSQVRHYWPSRHGGETAPRILGSKVELLYPLARRLPGHYRFTSPKDLADAIEWAKIRRIEPPRWLADGGDRAPIPADLFARLYADYERTKARAGVLDFEDMLVETVRLLEQDEAAAATVRARKTWFSVDEYQDTNALAERLLELWLGESRDLAVVGDPDQTIYSFTGATPDFLLGFERRHPGARIVALVDNYRSSPEVLALANRLVAPGRRGALQATLPAGPEPTIRAFHDDAAERAAIVGAIQTLLGEGMEPTEIAILVRINAQLPELEQALTRAGIPFRVRGQRFFDRREVRDARQLLRRPGTSPRGKALEAATGAGLSGAIRSLFQERLGLAANGAEGAGGAGGAGAVAASVDPEPKGDEARERAASLELLIRMAEDVATSNPGATVADVLGELDRRDADEASGSASGVNLLTYHRAKGLEWDAVFLPALEEGLMPIRQAKEADAVDEERRLLYVGITRARRHLALSWAARRTGQAGKEANRKPSRFLDALEPAHARGAQVRAGTSSGTGARIDFTGPPGAAVRRIAALEPLDDAASASDSAERRVLEALQVWRRDRARADVVPAYVVAHDAMLFAIAEARPESIAALARVKGIGPAKLERYGAEILEIVTRGSPGA